MSLTLVLIYSKDDSTDCLQIFLETFDSHALYNGVVKIFPSPFWFSPSHGGLILMA